MIVNIENAGSGGKGWSTYALGKNHDRKDATLILGDTVLGDAICESLAYKSGNYVRFVLSFCEEDNVTPLQGREIVKEWFEEFMHGFDRDEYHLDIVEHTDTEHLHYHARIPKLNLLTQTQLKPYYHKADLGFKIAVNEYIAHKHGLTVGSSHKRVLRPALEKAEQIQKWRSQHQQKPFTLHTKKERSLTQEGISHYISEMVQDGLINTLEDVVKEIKDFGFEVATQIDEKGNRVIKEGYDRGKDFHYLTISNDTHKIRIKGDIYGREFYEHHREDRAKAIENNRSIKPGVKESGRSGEELERALSAERDKRLKFIETQYGRARKRAYQIQDERSLRFDKTNDPADSRTEPKKDASVAKRDDKGTSRNDRRGETDTTVYAEPKPKNHTDANQTMDHTRSDGTFHSASPSGGHMGSESIPKQPNTSLAGTQRDHTSNEADPREVYQESMEQRSRGEEQAKDMGRPKEWTMDSPVRKSRVREHYDSTRRRVNTKPSTDASHAEANARRVREQLEADSRRLRAELQEAYEYRARQEDERRREFAYVLQRAYRTKQRDYQTIKDAITSRWRSHATATYIKRIFSEFRDKVDFFKSRIDRGNRKLFGEIKETLIEVAHKFLSPPSEAPAKTRFDEQKRKEILESLENKTSNKEQEEVKIKKEESSYSSRGMGM